MFDDIIGIVSLGIFCGGLLIGLASLDPPPAASQAAPEISDDDVQMGTETEAREMAYRLIEMRLPKCRHSWRLSLEYDSDRRWWVADGAVIVEGERRPYRMILLTEDFVTWDIYDICWL